MNVATYNFCNGGPNWDATHTILNELDADIVFAQELRNPSLYQENGTFTWDECHYLKPHWAKAPTDRPRTEYTDSQRWGSAIFIKEGRLEPVEVDPKLNGWVVGAEWHSTAVENTFGSPIKVFSVHTPTLQSANYYLWQAQEVCEYLEKTIAGQNAIVAGDFNITISTPHPEQRRENDSLAQEIRDYIRRTLNLLNCWQLTNSNLPLIPTHGEKSFIDAIFISAPLARFLKSSEIRESWKLGDHKPVVAHFSNQMPQFKPRKWPEGTYFSPSEN